jgi:hypothetical protein
MEDRDNDQIIIKNQKKTKATTNNNRGIKQEAPIRLH